MRVNQVKKVPEKEINFLPILCLDSSGSMGYKYKAASEGLQKLAIELQEGIFIEFSEGDRIIIKKFKDGVILNKFHNGGATALNETILKVSQEVTKSGKQCLINIFTDGGNNEYVTCDTNQAREIIQSLISAKHTFSFVCTKEDFNGIKTLYQIPESNILTYENNAEGVAKAFKMSTRAVKLYKTAFASGEDVTLNFYSKVL